MKFIDDWLEKPPTTSRVSTVLASLAWIVFCAVVGQLVVRSILS